MTRFTKLRPTTVTFGLPGMGNTTAHAGKPAPGQQSHHKLSTLDPLVARNEVLSPQADPAARARALIEGAGDGRQADETAGTTSMAPRRGLSALKKTLLKGAKGAAKVIGLARGEPTPHAQLLRYAGTPLKPDGANVHQVVPGDPQKIIGAFTALLVAEQDALDTGIAVNEAAAAEELVAGHLERTEGDLALSARRAYRLLELPRQAVAAAAELAATHESIELESGVLAATSNLLSLMRDALSREQQALGPLIVAAEEREQKIASLRSHVALLEEVEADQRESLPSIESERGVLDATSDLLRRMRDELAREQQALALPIGQASHSLAGLLADEQRQEIEERGQKIASLTSQVAVLEEVEADQRQSLSLLQTKARDLENRQQALERQIGQSRHIADVNQQLRAHGEAAEALRALQAPLQQVVQEREAAHAPSKAGADQAITSYAEIDEASCEELLQACPGFGGAVDLEPLREAVRAWMGTLDDRLAHFGAEALPKSLAMNMAFEALGIVAAGDPQRAAELVRTLQGMSLAELVSPVGVTEASSELGVAAENLARLLADEPSGLQMLELLLAPSDACLGPSQAEAARVYLLADEARRHVPEGSEALRDWITSAQRAAGGVAHAVDPAQALADCSIDERAAYRAFRNGYHSNEPGSDYDKANQHLKKPVGWLKDRATAASSSVFAPANPLNTLGEGLVVGAATALPTPARQAAKALEEAAAHLNDYLAARRQLMPPGQIPSRGELAWQAVAYHVQWHPEGSDLTTMKLDAQALDAIEQRYGNLLLHFEKEARLKGGGQVLASGVHPELDSTWKALQAGELSVLEAMNLLHERLPTAAPASPGVETDTPSMAYWRDQLHDAVTRANRLLHDGDPARVTSAQGLLDLTRDMIENLEWRDRLKLIGQKVWGLNAGPASAALAAASLPTGIGLKLVAGKQTNHDELLELYMGRTGLYLQLGEQTTQQVQGGAGVNLGYVWSLGDEEKGARVGAGGTVDWRVKREVGIENGVQLRVLRLSGGQEPALMAKFMDMYEHLLALAASHEGGTPAPDDWMRELLAHHDNLNIGLIDGAVRENTGTETSASLFAGLRLGEVDDRPRRVNLSISGGVKTKRDQTRTQTEVAGYMTTLYRDSTAQTKTEVNARGAAGVQLAGWRDETVDPRKAQQKASISATAVDLAFAAEVRAEGVTHFCTLFTRDKKIDPVRSDCAMDFLDFGAFEREVRREWNAWVNYGTVKLPKDMSEGMRYAVAEKQLEDMLAQARLFAKENKFATVYMDKAMKPKVAPLLDGLRSLANLQRKAGRGDDAERTEQKFDDFVAQPAMWEPTILMVREKPKKQADRGIDFFVKYQNNRIAEAMRTVGQWPPYEPVLRAEPGRRPEPARTWKPAAAEPLLEADGTEGDIEDTAHAS